MCRQQVALPAVSRVADLVLQRPRRAGVSVQGEAYPLAVSSAQASWWVQLPAAARSSRVDRCAAERPPEASLSAQESAVPSASRDARVLQVEAALAAVLLVQQPAVVAAEAVVPSVQPVEVAAEVAELLAPQPAVAAAEERASQPAAAVVAEERALPLAAVVEEVAERASQPVVAAAVAERVLLQAAAGEAAQPVLRAAAARPLAALSAFHPGRVLPWPAPPRAARFARAMPCSQIAPPTARWWRAARGEVWS